MLRHTETRRTEATRFVLQTSSCWQKGKLTAVYLIFTRPSDIVMVRSPPSMSRCQYANDVFVTPFTTANRCQSAWYLYEA
jgi:hypothetical protein